MESAEMVGVALGVAEGVEKSGKVLLASQATVPGRHIQHTGLTARDGCLPAWV